MKTTDRKKPKPKWGPSDGLKSWLEGKTADDLDVIEFADRPAYLETINRRNPSSGVRESLKVRICAPSHLDRAKARIEALEWCTKVAKHKGARLNWGEACNIFGEVYVDEMDTVCLVARCCRDEDDPQHQHMHYESLDAFYGRASIVDLWERLCLLDAWTDPRVDDVDEDDFWAVVERIDKVKNASPLVAIAGGARDGFVTSMASRLMSYRLRS